MREDGLVEISSFVAVSQGESTVGEGEMTTRTAVYLHNSSISFCGEKIHIGLCASDIQSSRSLFGKELELAAFLTALVSPSHPTIKGASW